MNMPHTKLGLATLAITLASTSLCSAAPWNTDKFDTGVIVSYTATQSDVAEDYYLVVQCIVPGRWDIHVESPIDWEDDASYAPDVPAIFGIDGVEVGNVAFVFDDRSLTEGIVAYAMGQELPFDALRDALASASSAIDLAYFDKRISFSSEGSAAAIRYVKDSCGG